MATALANGQILKGKEFSKESRQVSIENDNALLRGFFRFGMAVYETKVPATTDRIKAQIKFKNINNKILKIYIYNYGTAYDNPVLRNKNLPANWRLWESTDQSEDWESNNPKYIYTSSYDGRIDYLGPQNIFKVMFYADGGIPFISDGRFIIEQIMLEYSTSESLLPDIVTSKDVWIEGNYLLIRGRGYSQSKINLPGYEAMPRITALRLAKVDAYKKLGIALKRIPLAGGHAAIPGSQVKSIRYISDTEVETILEVPLASLHQTK